MNYKKGLGKQQEERCDICKNTIDAKWAEYLDRQIKKTKRKQKGSDIDISKQDLKLCYLCYTRLTTETEAMLNGELTTDAEMADLEERYNEIVRVDRLRRSKPLK